MNILTSSSRTRILKAFIMTSSISLITILLSSFQSKAILYNYIDTQVSPKNTAFLVNGNTGIYNFISTGDTVETEAKAITFTLNNTHSIKLLPYSSLRFLHIGTKPLVKIIKGDIEIQTAQTVRVLSHNEKIHVTQGGLKIHYTDTYSLYSNYYGNTNIEIYNNNEEFLLKYALPIHKQVLIHTKSNKSNWNNIRYSKLNKELRLSEFKEDIARKIFSINTNLISNTESNYLGIQEYVTFTPKKNILIEKNKLFDKISTLKKAIANKSLKRIQKSIQDLEPWKDTINVKNLPQLLSQIYDPLSRYQFEISLLELFEEDTNSISIEIKYFYSIWNNKNTENEAILIQALNEKIQKNKNNLFIQEEFYNLISSLIEAYPSLATGKIIQSKNLIEKQLFDLAKNSTEKTDVILASYIQNLSLIEKLIKNNNGKLAELIYRTMLIKTEKYDNERMITLKEKYIKQEENIELLLRFYKDQLGISNFNNNIFNQYQKNKKRESIAIKSFKKSIKASRKRPISYNFQPTVDRLKNYSIFTHQKNISFVITGGENLYIEKASLASESDDSFTFVYNPEKKIISQVIWNEESDLPSMPDYIPLKDFQKSYNLLLQMQLKGSAEEKIEKIIVQDWAAFSDNKNTNYNYENNIKKQLTQEELRKYSIFSKKNFMKVEDNNNILIQDAQIIMNQEEDKQIKDIFFTMQINSDTWKVSSLHFKEFPQAKIINVPLRKIQSALSAQFQIEEKHNKIIENAKQAFLSYNPNITLDDFQIQLDTEDTVSYTNMAIFLEEDIWRISGEFNSKTKTISEAQLTRNTNKYTIKDIKIQLLKKYLQDIAINTPEEEIHETDINDDILNEVILKEIKNALTEEESQL
jgi:hypothetical protein